MDKKQNIAIIAGPNGAGKSTTAPDLLREALGIKEFINADTIAEGLSAFSPENSALEAGKIMLKRIRNLAAEKVSFAFETTLAAKSFVPWLKDLYKKGYSIHIIYLWLEDEDLAVKRVEERVSMGGHSIPEHVIRRRYKRGIINFFKLYMPICSTWRIYDNSSEKGPILAVLGNSEGPEIIHHKEIWDAVLKEVSDG
jgi:predicted ABC-type ATPase